MRVLIVSRWFNLFLFHSKCANKFLTSFFLRFFHRIRIILPLVTSSQTASFYFQEKRYGVRETSFALEENRTCKKTYQKRFKIGNFYLEDDDRSALRKFDDSWRNDSTKIWFIFEKNRQKNRESQDECGIYSTETVGNKILNL